MQRNTTFYGWKLFSMNQYTISNIYSKVLENIHYGKLKTIFFQEMLSSLMTILRLIVCMLILWNDNKCKKNIYDFFLGLVILIENFIYYSSFALVGYSLGKNVRDKDADVSFFVLSKLNKKLVSSWDVTCCLL